MSFALVTVAFAVEFTLHTAKNSFRSLNKVGLMFVAEPEKLNFNFWVNFFVHLWQLTILHFHHQLYLCSPHACCYKTKNQNKLLLFLLFLVGGSTVCFLHSHWEHSVLKAKCSFTVELKWYKVMFQVGALNACYMAKRGFTVELFEMRPGK